MDRLMAWSVTLLCVCVSVTGSMLASLKICVSNVQIVMSASESAASLVLSITFLSLMVRLFFSISRNFY